MAENKLDGEVIGLSFDGTGYGTDGAIWGGEVLLCNDENFQRLASLSYVPMPGSTAAIREPWRMAMAYLYNAFGKDFLNMDLPLMKEIKEEKINTILDMIKKK
jgi:hydrogenase maturation protein HypF